MVLNEPVFDGKCCEMFGDTDAETERVYRELWARKPLVARIAMKRAHHRWVQSIGHHHARKRAEAAGLDVTALEANLDRTVTERIRRHGKALDTVQKLRRAKRCD